MSGIIIPADRTTKQQPRGYCLNPACRERSTDQRYEFAVDHDHFGCPKCGETQSPGVGLLTLTHLVLRDPRGPIEGALARFRLACDERRAYLATATNLEAATGEPKIANCPQCLAVAQQLGLVAASGTALVLTQ